MDIPSEIAPGLFRAEDVPDFNKQQAWMRQFPEDTDEQLVTVGDQEIVRLSRSRPAGDLAISRRSSEMAAIREIVQHGTAQVTNFRGVRNSVEKLREEVERLAEPLESITMIIATLQSAIRGEELRYIDQKIHRAAGYIAARKSLWVVTKSSPHATPMRRPALNIGLARLEGLALSRGDENPRHVVLPVVSGRNAVIGTLVNVQSAGNSHRRPKPLDVIEGIRTVQ